MQMHWRFCPADDSGDTKAEGLGDVHTLHTNAVKCLSYSHPSKILFSGGEDGRYISYDMAHEKKIYEDKVGRTLNIVQNPMDHRINALTLYSHMTQLILMDERIPVTPVLKLGYAGSTKTFKIPIPSWHPEGGLLSFGGTEEGIINIWDVRWNKINCIESQRPGSGVVTGDIRFDNETTFSSSNSSSNSSSINNNNGSKTRSGSGYNNNNNDNISTNGQQQQQQQHQHPIFREAAILKGQSIRNRPGGPTQILEVGGKLVICAAFHPTKNVLISQTVDNSISFM
ncbi:hypothetical protein BCR41DRAFT_244554 [Lobosporangium transversale]|uniref:WD40-repeat-containing domain protein n=1 Tax=Lobosporangium transversale TaxID=64571 RepID=A0A1Y2GVJ7_9FUNG|nr:hypothetical protein BCR41DRAFT_244554 [Lobosporangium transversale]ORZ23722.1 hypothetical protein BCR41DRAFT_244554 [Lobosporangium transversale]|eukprot:XP_021883536.1 hypothetical protein BCR41DRAFT_244554 [Lobosporangium transversale]